MIDQAIHWIQRNTLAGQGIIIHSRQRVCYPEVTGYFIPTLLATGLRDLARQYARWLMTVQKADGSFGGGGNEASFAFDTGQVIRGWAELVSQMPELEQPLRRACDWLIKTADAQTGRLVTPAPGGAWSLGRHGEVSEGIHLYVLRPLERAGEVLGEKRYQSFARKSLSYYLKQVPLTNFTAPNWLTHFYAYVQEALVELGCDDVAKRGMSEVARYQQPNGAVPGYSNVTWVCSTGLAQLAQVWYRLGEIERADQTMQFLAGLQNPSGGFFGSYGPGADYFPAAEISWATKYTIEAAQRQIAAHFDSTAVQYRPEIAESDGRAQAVLKFFGDLNGKRVLDAGCGKGRYAALLHRKFPRAKITALDISAQMLAHVPAGIQRVQNGLLSLPFPDGSFDAVLCIEALEHAVNIQAAVHELTRVLSPEGRLVIIDKNVEKLGKLQMPHWEKWFQAQELVSLLQGDGLLTQVESIGYDQVVVPDGLFLCWSAQKTDFAAAPATSVSSSQGTKVLRRLAVIPSDPLQDYAHKSSAYLRSYFNPQGYFDEVYCLSPRESVERTEHGMHVIPTAPGQLAGRLRELGINVVRAYGGYWACDFATSAKVPGVPVVVSVHDTNPDLLYPSILKADWVLCMSQPVLELVRERGVPADRSILLPNRVDFSVFHPSADQARGEALRRQFPGKYRILHVGRKAPQKNLDTLIRALADLGPDYTAVFLGAGNPSPFQQLAAQLGVSSQCHFLGAISNQELLHYYSFFDCMCTPSRWEGFGMVFTEALACGALVITSDISPLNQIVQNEQNGLLVQDYQAPKALAQAIERACTDSELARRLRAAAPASVQRFRKDLVDQQEVSIYQMLAGASSSGAQSAPIHSLDQRVTQGLVPA